MTLAGRVSPLGNPRINGCSPLPTAYRSVPRPSSPLVAKASTKCPSHRLIAFRVRILETGSRLDFPPTQRRRRTTGFPRSTAAPSGSNFKTRLFVSDPKPQPWRCAIPYEGMVLHRPAGTRPGASDRQPLFTMSVSREGVPPLAARRRRTRRPKPPRISSTGRHPIPGAAPKARSNEDGGAERDRTDDLMLAKHALSQLSYSPGTLHRSVRPRLLRTGSRPLRARPDWNGGPGRTRTSDLTLIRRAL